MLSLVLVALAVAASLVTAGTVPHAHVGDSPGLYNHEHDLTTLAAFGCGAPLPSGAAIAGALVISRPIAVPPAPRLRSRPLGDDTSRAPPLSA